MYNFKLNFVKITRSNSSVFLTRLISSEIEISAHILTKKLGMTLKEAKIFAAEQKLLNYNVEQLLNNITFCESLGYTKDDLIKYPQLLKTKTIVLDQRYNVLKESGFQDLSAQVLSKYRKLTNKTVQSLKAGNLIPYKVNVPENLISYLSPKPTNFDISDLNDRHLWTYVHMSIVKRYLKWRLNTTQDEIEKLYRIHKMIRGKSLVYLCENIALAEDLNFPPEKMLKFGYLLHNYPKYPKFVLENMPNLAGADMKKAMRTYPKLVTVSPKNYHIIYDFLKKENFPDETIRKSMNIFHVSPNTIKRRLKELQSTPEFRVYLHHPKILSLIVHHNRAKSRLSFLQEVKLNCASFYVLQSDENIFNHYIKEGRDVNLRNEVLTFIQEKLNSKSDEIETNLKKHPFFVNVPLLQIEETYNYLSDRGYKNEDLEKVVQLLLYPKEKVQITIEKITGRNKKLPRNVTDCQKLNLTMYLIEKEHHFTGNGVWRKSI